MTPPNCALFLGYAPQLAVCAAYKCGLGHSFSAGSSLAIKLLTVQSWHFCKVKMFQDASSYLHDMAYECRWMRSS